jgi:hypothetical protein
MGHILKAHAKNGEDPLENKFLLLEWNILGLSTRKVFLYWTHGHLRLWLIPQSGQSLKFSI